MDKKYIIKELVQIANKCDNKGDYAISDQLTRVASKIATADWGDLDSGNIEDTYPDQIREIAYEIMAEQGIQGEEIPEDILAEAKERFIQNYDPEPDF